MTDWNSVLSSTTFGKSFSAISTLAKSDTILTSLFLLSANAELICSFSPKFLFRFSILAIPSPASAIVFLLLYSARDTSPLISITGAISLFKLAIVGSSFSSSTFFLTTSLKAFFYNWSYFSI